MWLARCAVKQVMTFSKKISNATVCDYYSHFRQLVANMIDESKIQIGGPGIEPAQLVCSQQSTMRVALGGCASLRATTRVTR